MSYIQELSKKLREAREKAHRHICDLASGKKKWEMCVPVQPTDSDITLQAPLDMIDPILDELDRLIEESEGYKKHVVGGPESLGRMIQVYEDNRETMNKAYDRLIEVEKVLKQMCGDLRDKFDELRGEEYLSGKGSNILHNTVDEYLERADEIGKGQDGKA